MLRRHRVRPYLVFDGRPLPAKETESAERTRRKAERRAEGLRLLAEGDRKGAETALQACLDVTVAMRQKLVQACRELYVDYVVAPYEADAQLAYLHREGLVDGVISEVHGVGGIGRCKGGGGGRQVGKKGGPGVGDGGCYELARHA